MLSVILPLLPSLPQPPVKKKQGVKRKADTTTADPGGESAEEKKPARQVREERLVTCREFWPELLASVCGQYGCLYCTTVQCSAVQCSAVQCSAVHYIILNNGILKSNSSIFPKSKGYITQYTPYGVYGLIVNENNEVNITLVYVWLLANCLPELFKGVVRL